MSALTTIFTPPSGCFQSSNTPATWVNCEDGGTPKTAPSGCLWRLPISCFPTGASTGQEHPNIGWSGFNQGYHYSPGVLPSGFLAVSTHTEGDQTISYGCLPGWNTYGEGWCTSNVEGSYSNTASSTVLKDFFTVVMVKVVVTWASSDLSLFTPVSAPIFATPRLTSSFSHSSRPTPTTKQTATKSNAAQTGPPMDTQTATKPNAAQTGLSMDTHTSESNDKGLSTGAEAGIGVGAAAVVLLLLSLGFIIVRRKKRRSEASSTRPASARPYEDAKAELPERSEEAPPVPIASKPRFSGARYELQGEFQGHEAGQEMSPVEANEGIYPAR